MDFLTALLVFLDAKQEMAHVVHIDVDHAEHKVAPAKMREIRRRLIAAQVNLERAFRELHG